MRQSYTIFELQHFSEGSLQALFRAEADALQAAEFDQSISRANLHTISKVIVQKRKPAGPKPPAFRR